MKEGTKSTISLVQKGLTAPPPRLIGADYGTRGGEFYFFNGPGNLDYKFNNGTSNQSVRAFMDCAPLADIILKKAQAFANGLRSAEAAQGLAAFARKKPAPWTLSDKDPA